MSRTKRQGSGMPGMCGTCCRGEWVTDKHSQRDLYGLPILIRCPYAEHAVSRSMPACGHFREGNKTRKK